MEPIPVPNPRELLPPLLACLPTAFASDKPPPALLPLLSPILRQRVQLMSGSSTSDGSWLVLLSWDVKKASKIPAIIENITLEPHPVSGEIELEDVGDIEYRRLDFETLQARLDIPEFGLLPTFLWVTTDEAGGGDGWRLTELCTLEDKNDGSIWYASMSEANEHKGAAKSNASHTNGHSHPTISLPSTSGESNINNEEEDDDDYWASYDRTPSRTPAAKRSPAPQTTSSSFTQLPTNDELEYFARYASEVQPAMDAHDPDEEVPDAPYSTLNGDTFGSFGNSSRPGYQSHQYEPAETTNIGPLGYDSSMPHPYQGDATPREAQQEPTPAPSLSQPRPSSGGSLNGGVNKLEAEAETSTRAEIAVKQHISTDIKSLFRLARGVGMEREEFERVVKTEMELLGMMDMDE